MKFIIGLKETENTGNLNRTPLGHSQVLLDTHAFEVQALLRRRRCPGSKAHSAKSFLPQTSHHIKNTNPTSILKRKKPETQFSSRPAHPITCGASRTVVGFRVGGLFSTAAALGTSISKAAVSSILSQN